MSWVGHIFTKTFDLVEDHSDWGGGRGAETKKRVVRRLGMRTGSEMVKRAYY